MHNLPTRTIKKKKAPTIDSMVDSARALDSLENLDPDKIPEMRFYPEEYPPLEHQIPAVQNIIRFYKNSMKGIYNGYDPGLGKSSMSLFVNNLLKVSKVLVVCPANMRANWEDEIRLFATMSPLTIRSIYSAKDIMRPLHNTGYVVVSYNMLLNKQVYAELKKYRWDMLICDEAHALASLKSKTTTAVANLWGNVRRAQLLSGTPIRNCMTDLFPSLALLAPEKYNNLYEFQENHCLKRKVPWGCGYEYYHGKDVEEVSKYMRDNFFIRKTKEEVLPSLPTKTYQKVELDCPKMDNPLTAAQEKAIIDAVDQGRDIDAFIPACDRPHIAQRRIEEALKCIVAGKEFITNFLDAKIPIVLYAYHTRIMDALMDTFADYNPLKLSGAVSGIDKPKVVDAFNSGKSDLLVCQVKSAVGINLQHRCSTCIFIETSYSYAEVEQAMDRFCRIGQKSSVNGYFFYPRGSIYSRVFSIIKSKAKLTIEAIKSTD